MKSGSSTVLWQPANFDTHPSCGRSSKGSDFVAACSGMVMMFVILILIMIWSLQGIRLGGDNHWGGLVFLEMKI